MTGSGRDANTNVLLAVYEFEALVMLGNSDMDKVVDRVAQWPDCDPEVLESFAGEQWMNNVTSDYEYIGTV